MNYKEKLIQLKSDKKSLIDQRRENKRGVIFAKKKLEDIIKARWLITEAQERTQFKFKKRVEPLVTMAIRSIYPNPYKFELVFGKRAGKLTCTPTIVENGVEKDPMEDMGGGLVDIVSFALRVVLWSFERPKTNPIIFFDEPLKNMGELIRLGAEVMRKVANKLGFQLIINTHEEEVKAIADSVYEIENDGVESFGEKIK